MKLLGDRYLVDERRAIELTTGAECSVDTAIDRDRASQQSAPPTIVAALDAVRRILSAAETPDHCVRTIAVPTASQLDATAMVEAAACSLRRTGYVPVLARVAIRPGAFETLFSRHLVVFIAGEPDGQPAISLLQQLVGATRRAHIVVDLRMRQCVDGNFVPIDADRAGYSWVLRERAVPLFSRRASGMGLQRSVRALVDARCNRGLAFIDRHRGAAGERWLRAAFESARRHGDEASVVRALCHLSRHWARRDRWGAIHVAARRSLSSLTQWRHRIEAVQLDARALVMTGALSEAEALLAIATAEAHARGVPVPQVIRLRTAEVLWWQARFEEAAAEISHAAESTPSIERVELADPAPSGDEEDSAGAVPWMRGLIEWALGSADDLQCLAERLSTAHESTAWPSARRWRSVVDAEMALAQGDAETARTILEAAPGRSQEARLETALLDWLRARARADEAGQRAIGEVIRRTGGAAIRRWGLGRDGMHLLHAMPALLNVIHDAEDELSILRQACRWLRSEGRADAVGIVSSDGTRLMATDGLTQADLATPSVRELLTADHHRTAAAGSVAFVSAPMRFGGIGVGFVLARGPASSAATLCEAATTVAALAAPALRARLDTVALSEAAHATAPEIIGISPAMAAVREATARAAATGFPVLIEGESGTGKELVARAVHRLSARRDRAFCAVNCAALTDDLVEAELFGHARGAFTGAVGARAGLFEEAHAGTLLLDEVGELSPRAQAKVLRALQEREIRRVGENVARPVDVRIVAATNRPLAEATVRGEFREDLRFRLAVIRIRLPPLRERSEDVPVLASLFWRRYAHEAGCHAVMGADAIAALVQHTWPGNVRELQNAMAAVAVLAPTRGRVTARHVSQVLAAPAAIDREITPLDTARRGFERRLVTAALARHGGRRADAARDLGLTRQGLAKALKRLGVDASGEVGVA